MKGSYILLIKLDKDKNIKIGKLGNIFFKKGYYAYVGSALNGLEQRINRHLRQEKKFHWHIDYLLQNAETVDIFYKLGNKKEECTLTNSLRDLESVKSFGCSDCNCSSHLFFGSYSDIVAKIDSNNLMNRKI